MKHIFTYTDTDRPNPAVQVVHRNGVEIGVVYHTAGCSQFLPGETVPFLRPIKAFAGRFDGKTADRDRLRDFERRITDQSANKLSKRSIYDRDLYGGRGGRMRVV